MVLVESKVNLMSEARLRCVWCLRRIWRLEARLVSKAPSFKPEGLSSLPVSPGPELVTVVHGLRGYDGPSHGGPGRGFHRASDGGVVPLRPYIW